MHKEEFEYINSENKINADIFETDKIDLSVSGEHNRKNAELILALGNHLKLDINSIKKGLKEFKGTWRRQEYKGKIFDMECYDDYAHHPTEIKATLQAFREKYDDKKIIVAFMPHLYSRTKILFNDFVNAFDLADEVIVLPIYAARESFDPSINSEMLVREIQNKNKKAVYLSNIKSLKDYMEIHSDEDKVFITMGAGDIYKVYE